MADYFTGGEQIDEEGQVQQIDSTWPQEINIQKIFLQRLKDLNCITYKCFLFSSTSDHVFCFYVFFFNVIMLTVDGKCCETFFAKVKSIRGIEGNFWTIFQSLHIYLIELGKMNYYAKTEKWSQKSHSRMILLHPKFKPTFENC